MGDRKANGRSLFLCQGSHLGLLIAPVPGRLEINSISLSLMEEDQQYLDQKAKTEERMIRYLLGRLSEIERAQVEQEFFANNEYFENLLAVEDALIDRYLLNELSPVDRQAVEELLGSSPLQWQEMELARDLMSNVSKTASSKRINERQSNLNWRAKWLLPTLAQLQVRATSFSTVALLVLLAFSISLLAWNLYLLPQKRQAENDLAEAKRNNQEIQQQIVEERKRSEKLAQEMEEEKAKHQQAEQLIAQLQHTSQDAKADAIARINLSPDTMSRSSGRLKVVNIKADTDKVQIHLALKENVSYKQYSVSIKSFEGNEIWPSRTLDSNQLRRGRLVLLVPANVFSKNDYTITLGGISEGKGPVEIDNYSFRVIR
jgi:hypothetical protein